MNKTERDQRQSARFSQPVCTWLAFDNDLAAYATVTVDVCADGARFKMPRQVNPGEQVTVSIQLGEGEVECVGEVCWSITLHNGLHDFGVRFTGIAHEDRHELGVFLHSGSETAQATL